MPTNPRDLIAGAHAAATEECCHRALLTALADALKAALADTERLEYVFDLIEEWDREEPSLYAMLIEWVCKGERADTPRAAIDAARKGKP